MWRSVAHVALAVVLVAPPLAGQSEGDVKTWWLNASLGLGGAGVTSSGNVQGSPQAFARLGAAFRRGHRWGIEMDATASHEFGAGDGYGGPGATPISLVSLSGGVGIPLFANRYDHGARTVSAGVGAYRVIPSWYRDRLPDATVAGLHAAIDVPVWHGARRALVITTRGVLLPRIYGQRAWLFVIGPGLR